MRCGGFIGEGRIRAEADQDAAGADGDFGGGGQTTCDDFVRRGLRRGRCDLGRSG